MGQGLADVNFERGGDVAATLLSALDQGSLERALLDGGIVIFAASGTANLTKTLTVSRDITFDATGQNVTLSGRGGLRVFAVKPGVKFTLINVTVADGSSDKGAGLFNDGGLVTIRNCTFTGNSAIGADGANGPDVPFDSTQDLTGASGLDGLGGAIYSSGELSIEETRFRANSAQGGSGGIGGRIRPSQKPRCVCTSTA